MLTPSDAVANLICCSTQPSIRRTHPCAMHQPWTCIEAEPQDMVRGRSARRAEALTAGAQGGAEALDLGLEAPVFLLRLAQALQQFQHDLHAR